MGERLLPVVRSVLAYPRPPDVIAGPVDLSTWEPADPAYFGVDIELYIAGTDDPDGATDKFATLVCAAPWMKDHLTELQADDPGDAVWQTGLPYRTGRGLWLMRRWDHGAFKDDLDALLATSGGPTWPVVANRLSRHLDWEYDYRFDEAVGDSFMELG